MKLYHKNLILAFLFIGSVASFAQKQSKTFKETFNIKKGAVVELNASHADVEVTTWGKNQVDVSAVIEIEGLSKEEAEKYLKNYQFEALGNSNKVQISAGGNSFRFDGNDFIFFDPENIVIPDVDIPQIKFKMPEIEIPEINFVMPDMDFEKFIIDLDDVEFDFDKYSKNGKNYFFQWKDSVRNITIKNKKDWEKFKKSKEYKEWKEEMKKNQEKIRKELAKVKKETQNIDLQNIIKESLKIAEEVIEKVEVDKIVEESLKEARKAIQEIDREEIQKELAKVRKEFKKSYNSNYVFNSETDEVIINDKKVKITKKITIKVPKGVKLDLNTRHCKLKLPKMNASGKVSYGTFNADGLDGGNLDIYSSPVKINTIDNTTLNLKNVTDAKLASVTNSSLNSDSGNLTIKELFSGNAIAVSFGDISIDKIVSDVKNFTLKLNQSNAEMNVSGLNEKLNFDNVSSVVTHTKDTSSDKWMTLRGNIQVTTKDGQIKITGKYSELLLKR